MCKEINMEKKYKFLRFLNCDSERIFQTGIVYVKIDDKLIGAYCGYAGGAVWDSGFFIVDFNKLGDEQDILFDEAEESEYSEILNACQREIASFYINGDENYALSDYGNVLIDKGDEDNGLLTYTDEYFDGDSLGAVSDKWRISWQFDW